MTDQPSKMNTFSFSPDTILDLVEESLDISCTNVVMQLNSYINRVYELLGTEGEKRIIKFYRQGRWSGEAIAEEHRFLQQLQEKDIPVAVPLFLKDGTTLGRYNEIYFAIFPKFGGRTSDEFNDEQWYELGRLLARSHNIGAVFDGKNRAIMHPEKSSMEQLHFLLESDLIPAEVRKEFEQTVLAFIKEATPCFTGREVIHIHGDCHFSNILQRPGDALALIDFDDFAVGPPVQDLWMLLPDSIENSMYEVEMFLEGYEMFRSFDMGSLGLVESLRGMRFIHYMAWCAFQAVEDGNVVVMENFGTSSYWKQEIADLKDITATAQKDEQIHLGGNR